MKNIVGYLFVFLTISGFSQTVPFYKKSEALKFVSKALNDEVFGIDPLIHEENSNGAYFRLRTKNRKSNYLFVGRINTCKSSGCDISSKTGVTEFEYMDYFGLLDSTGKILDLKIYNYAATHGHEVTARSWLNQFKGFDGSEKLEVDRNIDAISGATSSVYAFTGEITRMVLTFKEKVLKMKE